MTKIVFVCIVLSDFLERQNLLIQTEKRIGDYNFVVLYPKKTKDRLSRSCFRGKLCRLAGNFFAWNSLDELIRDYELDFGSDIYDSFKNFDTSGMTKVLSATYDFEDMIGWESTDHVSKYGEDCLEEFNPNGRCSALRIKTTMTNIRAPKTSLMTIKYGILIEDGDFIASIQTIYPGVDIGPLNNEYGNEDVDITEREGRIFFDWNHPGE